MFEIRSFIAFAGLAAALCALVTWSKTTVSALAAVLAMNLAWGASPRTIAPIAGAGFQYEPHYENAFGNTDRRGYDVYRVASELANAVPSNPAYAIPLRFWYRSGDADLDSVQATYHWETSTIQHSPAAGMPKIETADMPELKALIGGYVVLLAHTEAEIDAGVKSLTDAGFSLGPRPPLETLHHGKVTVHVLPVVLVAGPS